jgi:hypothetical protein
MPAQLPDGTMIGHGSGNAANWVRATAQASSKKPQLRAG